MAVWPLCRPTFHDRWHAKRPSPERWTLRRIQPWLNNCPAIWGARHIWVCHSAGPACEIRPGRWHHNRLTLLVYLLTYFTLFFHGTFSGYKWLERFAIAAKVGIRVPTIDYMINCKIYCNRIKSINQFIEQRMTPRTALRNILLIVCYVNGLDILTVFITSSCFLFTMCLLICCRCTYWMYCVYVIYSVVQNERLDTQ